MDNHKLPIVNATLLRGSDPGQEAGETSRRWLRDDWMALAIVVVWATLLRVILILISRDHILFAAPFSDMAEHNVWASRIAAGDFWGNEPFFRAPLYPYFLALLHWLSGGSLLFARLVQAFIGGLSAALCFLLGRELLDRRIGLVAGLLLGSLWTAIYYDIELLFVVLEIPLGLAFVYFAVRAAGNIKVGWAALAGLFLGLGAITRPNILAVGAFIWVAFLIGRKDLHKRWKKILLSIVILYGVAAILLGGVAVRNRMVGKDEVLISWQGGICFWVGNNPRSDGMTALVPGTRLTWSLAYWEAIAQAEKATGSQLSFSQVDNYYYGLARDFINKDFPAFLGLLLRKTMIFANAFEVSDTFYLYKLKGSFWLLRYDPVGLHLILPLAGLGMMVGIRQWRRLVILYLFILFYSASVILYFVNARFRMPLTPFLAIFAAYAIFYFWDRRDRFNFGAWGWRIAILIALFLSCNLDFLGINDRAAQEAQAHYNLGTLYLERGRLEKAEGELQNALGGLVPVQRAEALNNLGIIMAKRGDLTGAESYFLKAVQEYPSGSQAYNNLGNLELKRGNVEAALGYFGQSLEVNPEDARAYYFWGKMLFEQGDLINAEQKLRSATELQPDFTEAWFELGRLKWQQQHLDAARDCFTQALHHSPDNPVVRAALADVFLALGDLDVAEAEYRRLLRLVEEGAAHYNLACILARRGSGDEAMAELSSAFGIDAGRFREMAATDPDLDSLRARDDFRRLLPK